MNERDVRIKKFLKKWNKMVKAATEIEDFKFNFEVTITSDNQFLKERLETIAGINESFVKNGLDVETRIKDLM